MNVLILFAKYPEAGRVKTRLAGELGSEAALEIYRQVLQDMIARTESSSGGYCRVLCYDPPDRGGEFQKNYPGFFAYWPQSSGDLGQRMARAFQQSFQEGAHQTILVGSDIPGLNETFIRDAFERLSKRDLILGPARDGGYYLIGAKSLHPFLFQKIHWSTSQVLSETLVRAQENHLDVELLSELSDIDTYEDYRREYLT